jgi:hypothetical protein
MPIIALHISLSQSLLKSLALHLVMYGAMLFVVMIVAAFCAGLILGHFWPAWRVRWRSGGELTPGSRRSEPPTVTSSVPRPL